MTPEEVEALNEQLATLTEGLNNIGERLNEFDEKLKPADPIPDPIDPALDPDNLPPADWKTFRNEVEEKAAKIAEEKLTAKEQAELEKIETEKQSEQEWNNKFDAMAEEATKQGLLPEVKNADDPNDAGNQSRKDLFGYAAKLNSTELTDIAEVVKTYNEQGKHFVIPEGKEPKDGKWVQSEYRAPGKYVPVGSSANRSGSQGVERGYKELHNTSIDMLMRKAKSQYGIE